MIAFGTKHYFLCLSGPFSQKGPQVPKSYNIGDRNILFGKLTQFDIHNNKQYRKTFLLKYSFFTILQPISLRKKIQIGKKKRYSFAIWITYNHMFSNRLFSHRLYEIKYHVSYTTQNSPALVTTCKISHVDRTNDAPVGSI